MWLGNVADSRRDVTPFFRGTVISMPFILMNPSYTEVVYFGLTFPHPFSYYNSIWVPTGIRIIEIIRNFLCRGSIFLKLIMFVHRRIIDQYFLFLYDDIPIICRSLSICPAQMESNALLWCFLHCSPEGVAERTADDIRCHDSHVISFVMHTLHLAAFLLRRKESYLNLIIFKISFSTDWTCIWTEVRNHILHKAHHNVNCICNVIR